MIRRIWHMRWVRYLAGICLVGLAGYAFLTYTVTGRLFGLYTVGGWFAPSDVRATCKAESEQRVAQLFTRPLDMNDEAKQGLREYWHYSYYRECLYRAGYTFLGKPLARATLTPTGERLRYSNPLAGIALLVPIGTTIQSSNELDVTFDYRLLRSTLTVGTTTVQVDTYTEHQFIHSFDDLQTYPSHFPATDSAFVAHEDRTTARGYPYLQVRDEDSQCGAILVTPSEHIVHLYTRCTEHDLLTSLVESLSFESTASVH